MKFFLSTTLLVVLFASNINAQHVNVGIKAGLNYYNIKSSGSEYDPKTGFHAGLIGHVHFTKRFALQPELVYSGQGAKTKNAGVTTRLNLSYINLPVMVQYMFDNGFRLQAGPQLGFLIKANSETNSIKVNIKEDLKTVDFGFGIGMGYVNPSSGLGVDARYNIGISNINDNNGDKLNNRGFQLGLFYLFKHK